MGREGWTPGSVTRFGWEVIIKSIQDQDESSKWVSSLINLSCFTNRFSKILKNEQASNIMSLLSKVLHTWVSEAAYWAKFIWCEGHPWLSLNCKWSGQLTIKLAINLKGPFNNYVTLKLSFFDLPTSHHHTSSWVIKRPSLSYVTPTQIRPYHLFLFLKLKKTTPRYKPTYDTFTHAFKRLNQINRFK